MSHVISVIIIDSTWVVASSHIFLELSSFIFIYGWKTIPSKSIYNRLYYITYHASYFYRKYIVYYKEFIHLIDIYYCRFSWYSWNMLKFHWSFQNIIKTLGIILNYDIRLLFIYRWIRRGQINVWINH